MTAKGVLAKLAGVETPEDARLDTGAQIAVGREELPRAGARRVLLERSRRP